MPIPLTVTSGWKQVIFFQDSKNRHYVIASNVMPSCQQLDEKVYDAYQKILHACPELHTPYAEPGKSFTREEDAMRYAEALNLFERLRSAHRWKQIANNGRIKYDPCMQIAERIKKDGYDAVLAANTRVNQDPVFCVYFTSQPPLEKRVRSDALPPHQERVSYDTHAA